MDYKCERCGYYLKSETRKESCPYCGEKRLIEVKAAEDLLGEL